MILSHFCPMLLARSEFLQRSKVTLNYEPFVRAYGPFLNFFKDAKLLAVTKAFRTGGVTRKIRVLAAEIFRNFLFAYRRLSEHQRA